MRDDPAMRPQTRTTARPALARLFVLTLLAGCESARGAGDGVDIESIPTLALREELRIGSALDPDSGFSRIGPVVMDGAGNTYVAETRENQVRVYDAGGRRIRTIGRRGGGPGEFEFILRMGLVGDTLWVGDEQNRRVTLFSLDGRVLATMRAPQHVFYPAPRWGFYLVGTTYRGNAQLASDLAMYTGYEGTGRATVAVPRVVFDTTEAIVDTIGFQRLAFGGTFTRVDVGSRELVMPRIADDTISVLAEEGSWLISRTMAASDTASTFGVVRLDAEGDTVYARAYRYRPARFEPWYLDSMAARFGARYRTSTTVDPDAAERAARENITLPPFQPPLGSARASQDGGLWLRRDSDNHPVQRWIMLDAGGAPRGQIALPANVTVKWSSGDVVWVSMPDEMEVPWLVRYRITPR